MSAKDFKKLEEFEILNIGMLKGGAASGCSPSFSDNDRLCTPICPWNSCKHDGCCGSGWDHKGDGSSSMAD